MNAPQIKNPLEKEFKKFCKIYSVSYIRAGHYYITSDTHFTSLCFRFFEEYTEVRRVNPDPLTFFFPCNTVAMLLKKLIRYRLIDGKRLLKLLDQKTAAT